MKPSYTTPVIPIHSCDDEALEDLSSLVPAALLQQAQDALSEALHIPILFVSPTGGPITKSSGLDTFCWKLTRDGKARRHCAECDRVEQIKAAAAPEPFKCPMGLQDVALPVMAGDLEVAYLISAQVMTPASAKNYAPGDPDETTDRLTEVARAISALAELTGELASANFDKKVSGTLDQLTGLANRGHFWDRLSTELEVSDDQNSPVSMLLIDLDDFKRINEVFGHATGDLVLKSVGQILEAGMRSSDLVARHGSDAFLVMLRQTDSTGADMVAWRLKNRIAECKITARGQLVPITASIGHVTYPDCATRDPDWLYKQALADLRRSNDEKIVKIA